MLVITLLLKSDKGNTDAQKCFYQCTSVCARMTMFTYMQEFVSVHIYECAGETEAINEVL